MLTEFASPLELGFLNLAEAVSSTIEPAATGGMSWYDALSLVVGPEHAYEFEEAEAHFTLVHDEVLEDSDFGFAVTHRERLIQNIDVMMKILSDAAEHRAGALSYEIIDAVRSNNRLAQKYADKLKVDLRAIDPLSVSLHRHFGMLTPWNVRNFSARTRERQHAYRQPILALADARNVVLESRTEEKLDAYLELVPDAVNALLLEDIIDDRKEESYREALTAAADELQVALLMESVDVL